MADFNRVIIVGNLTRDPELRFLPNGTPVCKLSVAVNREFRDKQEQKQKETVFLDVTVWGKQGENCASYLKKGRPVLVEGRLHQETWEAKDGGGKRSKIVIVADSVKFLGGRDEARGGQSRDQAPSAPEYLGGDDEIPF